MPRKWLESIEEFPVLQAQRWYRVRINAVDKDRTHNAIAVNLEHLDSDQQGRTTSVQLPLPIRPAGVAAEMFASCGLVGRQIAPRDAVGSILQARLAVSPDGTSQPTHFRPDPKASDTRETAIPANSPGKQNDSPQFPEVGQQGTQSRRRDSSKVNPAQPANPGTTSIEVQEDPRQRKEPAHG